MRAYACVRLRVRVCVRAYAMRDACDARVMRVRIIMPARVRIIIYACIGIKKNTAVFAPPCLWYSFVTSVKFREEAYQEAYYRNYYADAPALALIGIARALIRAHIAV